MKVKQKLVLIAVLVSSSLLALTVIFFILNQSVQKQLENASTLSKQAVSSSADTEATLDKTHKPASIL